MSTGILMYAHNNPEIDYIKIAVANAHLIKKNLKINNIALVTDTGTLKWAKKSIGKKILKACFTTIITDDSNYSESQNMRTYKDTAYHTKPVQFNNKNQHNAYYQSPFDETLIIDCDYLILSDKLNSVWGSNYDLMISSSATSLSGLEIDKPFIDQYSIKLFWATVIYFRKTEATQMFFSMKEQVKNNYDYYKTLYTLPRHLYRNDFSTSIAIHELNGRAFNNADFAELPTSTLLMSIDLDDIHSINSANSISVLCDVTGNGDKYNLCKVTNTDLHIMNKWSVVRHADKIIEVCNG